MKKSGVLRGRMNVVSLVLSRGILVGALITLIMWRSSLNIIQISTCTQPQTHGRPLAQKMKRPDIYDPNSEIALRLLQKYGKSSGFSTPTPSCTDCLGNNLTNSTWPKHHGKLDQPGRKRNPATHRSVTGWHENTGNVQNRGKVVPRGLPASGYTGRAPYTVRTGTSHIGFLTTKQNRQQPHPSDDEDYTSSVHSGSGLLQEDEKETEDHGSPTTNEALEVYTEKYDDRCAQWLACRDPILRNQVASISSLPSCPCGYPDNLQYDSKVWDPLTNRFYNWTDASDPSQRLQVYKKGAKYCIRSKIIAGSGSFAAQHCCYDNHRRLITRGKGAGTPNLLSPQVSRKLHFRVDILPWVLCHGDWTRYNRARPPNNKRKCQDNPPDQEYQRQIITAKQY